MSGNDFCKVILCTKDNEHSCSLSSRCGGKISLQQLLSFAPMTTFDRQQSTILCPGSSRVLLLQGKGDALHCQHGYLCPEGLCYQEAVDRPLS